MLLSDCKKGNYVIKRFNGNLKYKSRLISLGIDANKKISLLFVKKSGVVVLCDNVMIGLSNEIALNILVDYD